MADADPVPDPIRLCVVAIEYPLQSETFVIDQVRAQARRGFATAVVADKVWPSLPGAREGEGPEVVGPRWPLGGALDALERLPRRIRQAALSAADVVYDSQFDRFDVLLAHFGSTGARLARSRALGRFARPFATIFHGNDVALPMRLNDLGRYRGLFRRGDLLLPVSDYFRRVLVEAGAPAERTLVHRTGVDCASIPYRIRTRSPVLTVLTACRLVEKKGIAFALKGLASLAARRPDIDWRYQVIGDGPLLEPLRRLAADLGLGERVVFLGAQPHARVKAMLDGADVFLLPSVTATNGDMEGVPVVLMEAMAAGLPVVSTFHSGIPELVRDGETGLLAAERDAEALGQRLESLADAPELGARLADAARRLVAAEFDQDRLNDRLADLLRTLARNPTARRR